MNTFPSGVYTRRPLPVRAIQWLGDNYAEVCSFHGDETFEIVESPDCCMALSISTLEGDMLANCGDVIVRGSIGELYPVKPEAFLVGFDFQEGQPA